MPKPKFPLGMARNPLEGTEPRVRQLFQGSYPERDMWPQGLASAGLCVNKNNKKNMKKEILILIIIGVILISGIFYWFQIRPSLARKECFRIASTEGETERKKYFGFGRVGVNNPEQLIQEKIDDSYKNCLRNKGL